MYVPSDRILWDFWFAPHRPGEPYHLFHLDAPRDLPDPEDRHFVASIGHAVSDDLIEWRRVETALAPTEADAWDDRALWTGGIITHAGKYYLFYTALSRAEERPVQRIGVARSRDLVTWDRCPENPVSVADPRWYEKADQHPSGDEAWRDPLFVYFDPIENAWVMLVCARANDGPFDARGVMGRARSTDLVTWEPLPPLDTPREFGQLEVPQLVEIGGRWYLVFCTGDHSAERLTRTGAAGAWMGTHYMIADNPAGPFRLLDDEALLGDAAGSWYAGRIETGLGPQPLFFAWRRLDEHGRFAGALSNPAAVHVAADGRLSIDPSELWDDGRS
jgi:beta-fructofuranosidase